MQLKQYLKQALTQQISYLEKCLSITTESLERLKRLNTNNAEYVVNLRSLWEDSGERSTETRHKGRLDEAISRSESEFLKTNNRSDIQAEYSVKIVIGSSEYTIPEDFYIDFKRKR